MEQSIHVKPISLLVLLGMCIVSVSWLLPTIGNNTDDPNMIIYFNGDEGGQMDLLWHYFSGEKRASFQWDFDYGLELRYAADIIRIVCAPFFHFTPGTLVLVMRWFHLIAWVGALIAVWCFMAYHFRDLWLAALAVLLVGTRPAFSYFAVNLKPEPLVLLCMIAGLHCTLLILEKPSVLRVAGAVAMASLAFIVKFAGVFLLPAIVAAMYFALHPVAHRGGRSAQENFPRVKSAWALPSACGSLLIGLLCVVIIFYVRKSTGHTWYEQYGFWGSLAKSASMRSLFLAGLALVCLSGALWALNRRARGSLRTIADFVDAVNSYACIVCALFALSTLAFGFRWLISPKDFILTYSQIAPNASGTQALQLAKAGSVASAVLHYIVSRVMACDPLILGLFFFYAVVELRAFDKNRDKDPVPLFKRLTLLVFLLPYALFMFSGLRLEQHHMLPFFVAMSALGLGGIRMWLDEFRGQAGMRRITVACAALVLSLDIVGNGTRLVQARAHQFEQREDVAFEFSRWWHKNIPRDAVVVADHYTRVYIPPEYRNVTAFKGYQADRAEQLRALVRTLKPRFIYYNAGPAGSEPMPHVDWMLPGVRLELVKVFPSEGRRYQRITGDRLVIYKVLY